MRQIWITRNGAPEVLVVKEAPDPVPGQGEVRIRVEASGVNFADILGRLGLYPTCRRFRWFRAMKSRAASMRSDRASTAPWSAATSWR